jgi:hypothetical protein
MGAERGVRIVLIGEQVRQVARQIAGRPRVTGVLGGLPELQELRRVLDPLLEDDRFSRSACRAVLVLAAFPADGSGRELTAVARELDLSPSTTHRYISTWMAIGLLEQDARSRRYRRQPSGSVARASA